EPTEAQAFHIKTLEKFFRRFPILKQHLNSQKVDNECRQHALLNHPDFGLDTNLAAEEYWKKVFLLKNAAFPKFKEAREPLVKIKCHGSITQAEDECGFKLMTKMGWPTMQEAEIINLNFKSTYEIENQQALLPETSRKESINK
ncbi:hypothetical protein JTB14_009353, partial [Gonioctena quinquepunctata]